MTVRHATGALDVVDGNRGRSNDRDSRLLQKEAWKKTELLTHQAASQRSKATPRNGLLVATSRRRN